MTGYPKWIYWIQALLFYIGLVNNMLWLCVVTFLSGIFGPLFYLHYCEIQPSTYEQKRKAAQCTEEKAAVYRQAYKQTLTQEEEEEINETIRLVND